MPNFCEFAQRFLKIEKLFFMANNIKCKKTSDSKFLPDIPSEAWKKITKVCAEIGAPGITHLKAIYSNEYWLESIHYRDDSGNLLGVMDYMPVDTQKYGKKGCITII